MNLTVLTAKVLARRVDVHRQRALNSSYRPDCDTCGFTAAAPEQSRG